ncbi:MAG TPA: AraC family transcriptional regulator [Mobilitalea sp.]|nr:AraC family transcriptional regulator [Mobilitalea sp.]
MNIPKTNQQNIIAQTDFWDSLWTEIMISNQQLNPEDTRSFVEQSFMFSMFFRGCSQLEVHAIQTLLNIKDNGYIILMEYSPSDKGSGADFEINGLALYHYLKKVLKNVNMAIGPCIANRCGILITNDKYIADYNAADEGIHLANMIIEALHKEFHVTTSIGIGSVQGLKSFYTSYIEALTCVHYCKPNQAIHIQYLKREEEANHSIDYNEAEKYMLDAIRMKKPEAYDYFGLLMEWIKALNDDTKRNKILEILVMATHAIQIDTKEEARYFNYTGYLKELMELEGNQLIEWAFQRFIYITGYVKPQNPIDYTNRIVQATKDYLEAHYAEEISLENVAEQVNISPQYFSKLIKKTTGFNFIDWLSMLRVKRAKELLANSSLTVKEVCFLVGYKDPNYFSRIFKKRIGITPSEFVKNNSLQQ